MSYMQNQIHLKSSRRNLIKTLKGINPTAAAAAAAAAATATNDEGNFQGSEERKTDKHKYSNDGHQGHGNVVSSEESLRHKGTLRPKVKTLESERKEVTKDTKVTKFTKDVSHHSPREDVDETVKGTSCSYSRQEQDGELQAVSKQTLKEFLEEVLDPMGPSGPSGPSGSSGPLGCSDRGKDFNISNEDLNDYLNNYQEFRLGKINDKINGLYQSFLKQNRQGMKHLAFLDNWVIQDQNLINTYFDRIYVLNLDRRPDRWALMKENLDKLGIYNYERFSATDGSLAPHYQEWKHYSKMPLTRHELIRYKRKAIGSAGSWAILKASYRMLRDAKERGFKRILVLQDDLLFHKNFLVEFARVPSYVKNDWKLLYLGATQHNWTRVLKSKHYYYPAGTADGAFAVGVDCSIFDELMKEIIKFNMPFDSGALRTLQERYLYDSIVLDPNLIIADIRDSDLRHSRDLVTFGKRFRWDTNLYNIDI